MVALDGGRHATSDVNDLYRRVINRNNRLKKLLEIHAPDVILRNEKRILQEAVDALIDNSIRHGGAAYSATTRLAQRPLKSLSDNLKGKHGSSARTCSVSASTTRAARLSSSVLNSNSTSAVLPKHMALELFRPFVIGKLLEKELAYNIRGAGVSSTKACRRCGQFSKRSSKTSTCSSTAHRRSTASVSRPSSRSHRRQRYPAPPARLSGV
jgi:DNA-directed RNA polymerase subunit beta'